MLGPLTNPAAPSAGLIGCAFADLAPVLAQTFAGRGTSALVVRGDDGLDELTTTTTSHVWQVVGGTVTELSVDPGALGIATVELSALQGGDAQVNAGIARELLDGRTGPVREAVLLNAAAAIVAFEQTEPFTDDTLTSALSGALDRAASVIDSGAARELLGRWVRLTAELGSAH